MASEHLPGLSQNPIENIQGGAECGPSGHKLGPVGPTIAGGPHPAPFVKGRPGKKQIINLAIGLHMSDYFRLKIGRFSALDNA